MELSKQQVTDFQEVVWEYYRAAPRPMPWRDNPEPYRVLVSELMLQQTQVSRVLPKFVAFIKTFPTIQALARANFSDVLRAWSGLGYNRRAKFLHQAAQKIVDEFGGVVPRTLKELTALPGIGKNTAGAILTYAYNQPVVFIETNIRSVYFYHFFTGEVKVDDKALTQLVQQTLDHQHPRQWYWALMDYGSFLKQTAGNNINRSRHYAKQSKFAGSRRQLRGKILRALLERPHTLTELAELLDDARLLPVVSDLKQERFIIEESDWLKLTDHSELP